MIRKTSIVLNIFKTLIVVGILLNLSGCHEEDIPQINNFNIIGETMALSIDKPSYLIKNDAKISKVYKRDKNGNITIFKPGIDYIEVQNGGLKRTPQSLIPDFSAHKMILNSNGKFTWQPEPNRNPELSLLWQVMVDYNTYTDNTILSESNKITQELKEKLKNKEDISIQAIGTSITAGAHTLPQYYDGSDNAVYIHLIAKAINSLYGNQVSVNNLSIGGATTSLFTSKIDFLISQKPDIVFVEFGMNEHLIGSNMDDHLDAIEAGIKKLLSTGINCVLIGFFQQNPYWEAEDINSTIYFNSELRKIAESNNIYFSDIYSQFELFSEEKKYRDLMGDYHHHPTDFGHKLYYLTTMPFILFSDKKESELLNLIN